MARTTWRWGPTAEAESAATSPPPAAAAAVASTTWTWTPAPATVTAKPTSAADLSHDVFQESEETIVLLLEDSTSASSDTEATVEETGHESFQCSDVHDDTNSL